MRSSIPSGARRRPSPTRSSRQNRTNLDGVRTDNFEPRPRTLSHLLLRWLSIGSDGPSRWKMAKTCQWPQRKTAPANWYRLLRKVLCIQLCGNDTFDIGVPATGTHDRKLHGSTYVKVGLSCC